MISRVFVMFGGLKNGLKTGFYPLFDPLQVFLAAFLPFNPSERSAGNGLDELLHPVRAGLFHPFGDVVVNI